MEILSESKLVDQLDFELQQFILKWDEEYKKAIQKIPLFDTKITEGWSLAQRQLFAKVFYHVRGHFHDFLWYIGNHSTNASVKALILDNISEEFGEDKPSHEQLYFYFSDSLGADLKKEIIKGESYLPFAKRFNEGHLEWLMTHDEESRLAAFAAYERLDNIDYSALLNLVRSLGVSGMGEIFFVVHNKATHFERLAEVLGSGWKKSRYIVTDAFDFIFKHQISMWNSLSQVINNQAENI